MRSVPFLPILLALAVPVVSAMLGGCQNARGRVPLEQAASRSISRFWHGTAALVGGEGRRSFAFAGRVRSAGVRPAARLEELVGDFRRGRSRMWDQASRVPATITRLVAGLGTEVAVPTRDLVRTTREFRLSPMLARWRDETMKTLESLDISTPILAAPGDPHWSPDPEVVRRPSWVERLLTRF